ncbi:MAG: Ku protein [Deltaproteobacteria bacterium]|nr:Ku protein [Deltaproteobacteria bacterium]
MTTTTAKRATKRTTKKSTKPATAAKPARARAHAAKDTSDDAEKPSRRALWSGTLGFGLLQIPVSVHPLERSKEISFHQLDGRDLSPVGYKRYNKTTGDDVPYEEIVRGYEVSKGQYVVVSDDELEAANVEATQSIDIMDFVDPSEIHAAHFERPYLLTPGKRGEKAFAVLLEALESKGRAAIATVVLRQRQHLAAVLVEEGALVLEILRFAHELRPIDATHAKGHALKINAREREMAEALIDDMTVAWDPDKYRDSYRDDVLAMIERKTKTGEAVTATEPETKKPTTDVADLTELLRKSLRRSRDGEATASSKPARKKAG